MEELLARIRACIRRQSQLQETHDELNKPDSMIYMLKGTNVNLRSREVLQDGTKIDFTPKEFELLVYLIEHQNEILSREQIMNGVWGYDFLGNSNLVDVYIRYVRKTACALSEYSNNPWCWIPLGGLTEMKIKTKASLLSFFG